MNHLTNHVKPVNELITLANNDINYTLLRYSIEELKNIEDADGWTFLHYYCFFNYKYVYNFKKLEEFHHLSFDFYRLSKNNKNLLKNKHDNWIKKEDYNINHLAPIHLFFINYAPSFVENVKDLEYLINIESFLENNILLTAEDNIGFTSFIYALHFKNYNSLNFFSKTTKSILSKKIIEKYPSVIEMINGLIRMNNNSFLPEGESKIKVLLALKNKIEKEVLENSLSFKLKNNPSLSKV